jgi:hypothetical protein
LIYFLISTGVIAKDLGQWQHQAPDIADYFKTLMQPDRPYSSCCGSGDAYYADNTEQGPNRELFAIITDTRPDGPLKRAHIEPGTRVYIPPTKIRKVPIFNPLEHTLVFIGHSATDTFVYCYEPVTLM